MLLNLIRFPLFAAMQSVMGAYDGNGIGIWRRILDTDVMQAMHSLFPCAVSHLNEASSLVCAGLVEVLVLTHSDDYSPPG